MERDRQQVYIAFNDDTYRVFKSYESVIVEDQEAANFRIECKNQDGSNRTLLLNKGSVKFIDVGPVYDD